MKLRDFIKSIEELKNSDEDVLDADVAVIFKINLGKNCILGGKVDISDIPENWSIEKNKFYLIAEGTEK